MSLALEIKKGGQHSVR